jgi:hypothetical protein
VLRSAFRGALEDAANQKMFPALTNQCECELAKKRM